VSLLSPERLDRLEDRVRLLDNDRAVALVKQLRALSNRGDLDAETFEKYMQELERNIHHDLSALSAEDRALVEELKDLVAQVFRGMRPAAWKRAAKRLLIGHIPSDVDDFGRDQEFIDRIRPLSEFLFEKYWRISVEGLENVPSEGPCLLVSNHSGQLPFDAWMIQYAVQELHPAGRLVRFLIEDWFTRLPFLSSSFRKMGQVRGSQDNAARLLQRGEIVGIFPEGVKGLEKSYRNRYHLQRFGRGGSIRLAMKTRAPVLPVAVLGAEETYPVLFTSGFVANMLRMPYFPVTPLFPWLGPLGLLPLPSKWRIRFGERIPLGEFSPGAWEDDILVNTLNEDVRQTIQEMLSEMVQQRRSLFFG
jgi:1-acyl-sn-glycerol-3-phosphate acyltransferase